MLCGKRSTHDVIKNHSQAKKEIEFCYFHWWIKGCSFVSFHCAYNSYFQRSAKIPIRNKTQKLQPQKMNGELSIHLRAHRAACHLTALSLRGLFRASGRPSPMLGPFFFIAFILRFSSFGSNMFFNFSSCCLGKCSIHTPAIQIFWDFFLGNSS